MSPAPSPQIRQAYVTADTTLVTVAETAAVTVSGLNTDTPDNRIDIRGTAAVLLGTAATGVFVRIRRGTDTTGALVGEPVFMVGGATQQIEVPIEVQDTPGAVAGQSYTLTVQQNAASANGTVVNADITAEIPIS